jgi:hypothetical protein
MFQDMIVSFALAHREYFYGLATAYAISHIPQAVAFAFHLAMKWPWLRAAVVANPAQAKAIVDSIRSELDKDIDEEASPAPAPAAPPANPA